jgi:DNA polymerase-3 subunit delta'
MKPSCEAIERGPCGATLGQIRGQPRVVEQLGRAIALGRVPHAYLFTGPAGSGKFTTALALAAAMNCERAAGGGLPGCGACAACERIGAGRHPDVVTLERQGASQTVPIEVVRRQVIASVSLPPHEARARFFLVEEATSLLDPAANAILKTLEEPPARTHFVLCTSSAGELLPTIKSRCQRVHFQPLAADLAAELEGQDSGALRQQVDELLEVMAGPDRLRQLRLTEVLASDRGEALRAVRLLAQTLHQRARAAADAGDLARASSLAHGARRALDCEMAMSVHNAHALLALEHLARDLSAIEATI